MFSLFKSNPNTHRLPIFFYDSKSQSLREFTPLNKKAVTLYSCGPTVYDHIHIGNLRAYLVPDLAKRVLMYNGYQVTHTINFTDFGHLTDDGDAGEDKIMKGMKRDGYDITLDGMRDFAVPYIESFKQDNITFGNIKADHYARASDYVKEQINIIKTLEEKGYAYQTSDGLYFEVEKFPEYGALGNIDIDKIRAGARVEVNTEKRHPADFALWKNADLGFESRWGTGFPGWHIECTAMAFATLGKQIDIHTGGEDLLYTHHNGELAQAECVTGKQFSQFWLHNNFVTMGEEKMAKSTGAGMTLSELVEQGYSAHDYRYWLLQSHYRSTASFSLEALDSARTALSRLKRYVYEELAEQPVAQPDNKKEEAFATAINHDLDTPKALALLWEVVKSDVLAPAVKLATIQVFDSVLEIGLSLDPEAGRKELGFVTSNDLTDEIAALVEERDLARTGRNWPESDRLRDLITKAGYQVEDSPDGTKLTKQ